MNRNANVGAVSLLTLQVRSLMPTFGSTQGFCQSSFVFNTTCSRQFAEQPLYIGCLFAGTWAIEIWRYSNSRHLPEFLYGCLDELSSRLWELSLLASVVEWNAKLQLSRERLCQNAGHQRVQHLLSCRLQLLQLVHLLDQRMRRIERQRLVSVCHLGDECMWLAYRSASVRP